MNAAWLCSLLLLIPLLSSAASRPLQTQTSYGQFPAYFEANHGQADERFQFIARGQHHGICLAPAEALLALARPGGEQARSLRLTLVGANVQANAAGQDKLPGTVNYFLGNDPARWRTGVPTFARVRFESVYPGIDLVYHSSGRQLEYDFLIAPGANPRAILLHFDGADSLRLGPQGEIILEAGGALVLQHQPVLYQTIAGARREIPGRYQLRDARTVAFAVGRYDTNHPLVIDPILSYSTFLGGSQTDNGWAIAVDSAGSAYVAGETLSKFKDLPGPGFQTNYAGGNSHGGDAFVAKINPAGTGFEFLTYLGGKGLDGAVGLALDTAGNPYVTGYTDSSDFPVTAGALQTQIAGRTVDRTSYKSSDAFITKLNPSGSALVYSTYLGGSSNDSAFTIAVDAAGFAYVVGYTETAARYRTTNRVCTTVCTNTTCGATVCKTNVTKTSSFVLGSDVIEPVRTTITGTNPPVTNVVYKIVTTRLLGVETLDPGFPITNAVQPFHGGSSDCFISKISRDGSTLVYSTYLGGFDDDLGTGIAVDAAGNATVCGWTESGDFPVLHAFQPLLGGRSDAVVAKFDPSGALIFSTYLGGTGNDVAFRVALDPAGCAYVTGAEDSEDFPSTPGGINRGGVFKSADAGQLWRSSGAGITHTIVEALAFDPTNSSVLYAGTLRGVFRTVDAGAVWESRSAGLSNTFVHALAADPAGRTLYAGTSRGMFVSANDGLFWSGSVTGIGTKAVFALAVAPGAPPTVLAGTHGSGIYRTTNNAAHWKSANSGLGNLDVNAFAVHPTDPNIIYVATSGGVYKSTNNGVHWRGSTTGLGGKKSQALAIDPAAPGTIYAGTTKGLFKSLNDGANWTLSSDGLNPSNVTALAIDPSSGSTLYAGTTNGLFRSTDAGATWTTNSAGLVPRYLKTLLIDPASTSTLYAGIRSSNTFGGSNDVFLTKFLPDGSGLAYSVTFGGKKADQGWGVAVDASGRAFVTGSTGSTNFPVVNASTSGQTTNSGKTDVFLAGFDPDASLLLFSIYLGGKKRDLGYAVALDGAGAVYLTGHTESSGFPTNDAIQVKYAGSSDAFITKVIPEALLSVARGAERVVVYWPGPMPGFTLEGAEDMSGAWTRIPQPPVFKNGWTSVTLPASSACRFFRLKAANP